MSGHMFSGGFSVLDVRDPRNPKPVNFVPAPPNTWSLHLQAHDDLLLVINGQYLYSDPKLQDESVYYSGSMAEKTRVAAGERGYAAGIRIFDISDRPNPREISFLPIEGVGAHRIWYVGGRWAYASALVEGFIDTILLTIDLADPSKPEDRRPELAAGDEQGCGRAGRLGPEAALCLPPRDRGRRYRLCDLAGWRDLARRCQRPARTQRPSSTATGARPTAAAPTTPCRCRTGTCSWWSTRPSRTSVPTA